MNKTADVLFICTPVVMALMECITYKHFFHINVSTKYN